MMKIEIEPSGLVRIESGGETITLGSGRPGARAEQPWRSGLEEQERLARQVAAMAVENREVRDARNDAAAAHMAFLSKLATALGVPFEPGDLDDERIEELLLKAADEAEKHSSAATFAEQSTRAALDRMTLLAARVVDDQEKFGGVGPGGLRAQAVLDLRDKGGEPGWWTDAIARADEIPF